MRNFLAAGISALFFSSFFTQAIAQCGFTITHSNSNDHCLYAEEEVVWKSVTGAVTATGNNLLADASASGNAGALSINTVKDNGYATTVINGTTTQRMFGLASSPSATPAFNRAQFGIFFQSDGKFTIYESSQSRGTPAGAHGNNTYIDGDVFKIWVDRGAVKYYQNTTLLFISAAVPSLPLTVESTLWASARMEQVKVVNGSNGAFSANATSPGTGATYQWYNGGIPIPGATSATYTNSALDNTDVLTCKLTTGTGGCAASGTIVDSNTIRFSTVSATTFGDYNVLNNAVAFGCLTAMEPVVFATLTNAEFSPGTNTVFKSRSNNAPGTMDAGAFSVNSVLNNGYVDFVMPQNDKGILVGLSHVDGGTAMNTIDFAFYARPDHGLEIYEGSSNKGTFGTYNPGDHLKIEVDNNAVKYYVGGTLKYISGATPNLPLYFDVNMGDTGYGVSNAFITNATTGSFSLRTTVMGASPSYQWTVNGVPMTGANASTYTNTSIVDTNLVSCEIGTGLIGCAPVTVPNATIGTTPFKGTAYITGTSSVVACTETEESVTFTDLKNVSVSGNSVQKVAGTSGFWNAGATSLNKVDDNGYARITMTQITDVMFGLSSEAAATTHSSSDDSNIQYGLKFFGNNTYLIVESGTLLGGYRPYSLNDQFKIRVDNGIVRYYRNSGSGDVLIDISPVSASARLPLVVDVSLNALSAWISNVIVSNGSSGVFQTVTSNMGASPLYQWKLNGPDAPGASTLSSYTNGTLTNGDIIACFMTPDIAGCATQGFLSNQIKVSAIGGITSPATTWTGAASADWDNPSNWTAGVPKGYTKVTIPSTSRNPQMNLAKAGVYDLTIDPTATLAILGTNNLYVFNDLDNRGTLTVNTSTVQFKNCTNNKNAIISASPENFYKMIVDNKNGVDVTGEHHIQSDMTFTSGIISYAVAGSNLIVFDDGATATGASNASHVQGPVKKIGDDAFTFPIGKGGKYREISISNSTNPADEFTAEYFKANPSAAYTGPAHSSFWSMSGCEYWDLEYAGGSPVVVALSWNLATACPNPPYITDPATLRVTYWDGANWNDGGHGSTSGDADNGTITSSLPITSYQAFTLASLTSANPLPLTLTSFRAVPGLQGVSLTWTTQTEFNTDRMEVERSDGSSEFSSIGFVHAAGYSQQEKQYELLDRQPAEGKNYYRLRMVDLDGTATYSKVIVADVDHEDAFFFYPNPVKKGNPVYLKIPVQQLKIVDSMQRPVLELNQPGSIDTSNLAPGIYFCYGDHGAGFQRLIVY